MVLMRTLLTFAFVCFTWIFFRANTPDDAQYIVANLFTPYSGDVTAPLAAGLLGAQVEFVLVLVLIGLLLLVDALDQRVTLATVAARMPLVVRWTAYYGAGAAVILSGLYGAGAQQFIYFQF
jgi:hypothetical protein